MSNTTRCNLLFLTFDVDEGSSLMQAVSACGNVQHQPMVPLSDEACRMAFNLQPGPIPGVRPHTRVDSL